MADAISIAAAFLGAVFLRYYPDHLGDSFAQALPWLPIEVVLGLAAFGLSKMYRTLWRYASINAVVIIGYGTLAGTALPSLALVISGQWAPHWSVFPIQWLLLMLIVGGGRLSIRLIRHLQTPDRENNRPRLLIYGAGDAGEMIARDLLRAWVPTYTVVGFIDDDPYKEGKSLHGLPVLGGARRIREIVEAKRVDEIVVAIPSLPGNRMREILNYLRSQLKSNVRLKTVPGISELIKGTVTSQQIRSFDVSDLLRRSPVELGRGRVERLIKGRCVLVTGAGGSIGSEICRQVAVFQPAKLVAFDHSEPNLYEIREELARLFPEVDLVPIVGDISHRRLLKRMFTDHSPVIVFHAAAYKHVPLMQLNPWSAVFNNISGTRVLLSASAEHQVERFVMISTDKAVRPSSIMGATKRVCEMLVQLQTHGADSVYSIVRFGNVMGSSGSVIPKFERQIKTGGPVTVSHPEATRYFMLTSEAVQLVMQAATLGRADAVYILDMGDPIKIDDLARDMIQLHGLQPDKQIEIVYTGLLPGEKLHEELYHTGSLKTEIDKIWLTEAPPAHLEKLIVEVDELLEACYSLPRDRLTATLARLVPDFKSGEEGIALRAQPIGTNGKKIKSHQTTAGG